MKYTTDIRQFHKRRAERLRKRGVRFDYDRPSDDYDWITINGVHTPIDEAGTISGGASGKFNGKKYTGTKMQRSKKRQEKVGGSKQTAKVDVNSIKNKRLKSQVEEYVKTHNGELPDKVQMHDYSYSAYDEAIKTMHETWDAFADKYRGVSKKNLAQEVARLEETKKSLTETIERHKDDEEAVKTLQENIDECDRKITEIKKTRGYKKHESDFNNYMDSIQAVIDAKEDNKAFMYNKGDAFKNVGEVTAYLDTTGFFSETDFDDVRYWKHVSNISVEGMDKGFAVSMANAAETFRADFPKMNPPAYSLRFGALDYGAIGQYDPDDGSVWFAESYTSAENIKYGEKTYKEGLKSGHHPKGTSFGSSAYHEFVHAMDMRMKKDDRKNICGDELPSTILFERVRDKISPGTYPDSFKMKVSKYAARYYPGKSLYDNMEFLAEAMSEAYTSEAPREIARVTKEEFTKLYHEIYD